MSKILLLFDRLTLNIQRLHHVVVDELKVLVADPVLHIPLPPREEVVHHRHLMAVHHQLVGKMGPHKTSPAGYLLGERAVSCLQKKQKNNILPDIYTQGFSPVEILANSNHLNFGDYQTV